MRLKLFFLLTLMAVLPALAQQVGLYGVVVGSRSGQPVSGATVLLDQQGNTVTTGPNGDFQISDAQPGNDVLVVLGYGYKDWEKPVEIVRGMTSVGTINIEPISFGNAGTEMNTEFRNDMILTEAELEDEEGNTQAVGTLTGATDDPFYQAASYDFSIMRFRQSSSS